MVKRNIRRALFLGHIILDTIDDFFVVAPALFIFDLGMWTIITAILVLTFLLNTSVSGMKSLEPNLPQKPDFNTVVIRQEDVLKHLEKLDDAVAELKTSREEMRIADANIRAAHEMMHQEMKATNRILNSILTLFFSLALMILGHLVHTGYRIWMNSYVLIEQSHGRHKGER
jgi:hypothetical protein